MKITKRQLKRIIREERARLIKEQPGARMTRPDPAKEPDYLKTADEWVETLGQLIDQDMADRNVDLRDEGGEVVEALEMLRREYKDEMRGPTR
jgi:hypothetical protein